MKSHRIGTHKLLSEYADQIIIMGMQCSLHNGENREIGKDNYNKLSFPAPLNVFKDNFSPIITFSIGTVSRNVYLFNSN